MRPVLTAALAAAFALAGCGGDDDGESDQQRAEQTVRDFVEATNERSPRLCDELVTLRFLERTAGGKGDEARRACKQQLKAVRSLELEIRKLDVQKAEGGRATVAVELETNGVRQPRQTLELVDEDGRFRLNAGRTE